MTLTTDDRLALDDLVHRYALLVDRRAFDAVGELFTDDALLRLPDPPAELEPRLEVRGRAAVVQALGRLTGFAATFHAVVGRIADPAGPDRASGRVACQAHHVSLTGGSPHEAGGGEGGELRDLTWHLHYDDEYARVDGRWLIARRALGIELVTTGRVRAVRTIET